MSSPSLRELQLGLSARLDPGSPGASDAPDQRARASDLGVAGDDRLDAEARIGIYAHMVFARIRDAIAEDYGALQVAVGEATFDEIVRAYLRAHPTHHFSLRRAGSALRDFVASGDEGAPGVVREAWCRELVALEAALVEAFDAVDEPLLARGQLERLEPSEWASLELRPARSLVLLEPAFAVEDLRAALLRQEEVRPTLAVEDRALRVWRQDLAVYHRRISRTELDALRRCGEGLSFGELCGWLVEVEPPPADPAATALDLMERWLGDSLLVDTLSSNT